MLLKMKIKKGIYFGIGFVLLMFVGALASKRVDLNPMYNIGEPIDSLNNVVVYYNGGIANVTERHFTKDGYNLGLKYQCVEFVKRYYYEHFNHKMPDSYGNAKDFFDNSVADTKMNKNRGLIQCTNPSVLKPKTGDIIVFEVSFFNSYEHVAIVSSVDELSIEIIQQNAGPFGATREIIELKHENKKWRIENDRVSGWLSLD